MFRGTLVGGTGRVGGGVKFRVGVGGAPKVNGLREVRASTSESSGAAPTDDGMDDLRAALGARAEPLRPAVELDLVQPILEERGVKLDPVDPAGRDFGTAEQRRDVARNLWGGRWVLSIWRDAANSLRVYRKALDIDRQNLVVALDRGQIFNAVSGDRGTYPEFKGNVKTVETRGLWRPAEASPKNQGYHYNQNAETYLNVGQAMAKGMIELLDKKD